MGPSFQLTIQGAEAATAKWKRQADGFTPPTAVKVMGMVGMRESFEAHVSQQSSKVLFLAWNDPLRQLKLEKYQETFKCLVLMPKNFDNISMRALGKSLTFFWCWLLKAGLWSQGLFIPHPSTPSHKAEQKCRLLQLWQIGESISDDLGRRIICTVWREEFSQWQ